MADGTPAATPEIIIRPTADTNAVVGTPAPPFTAGPQTTGLLAAGLLIALVVALCVPLQSWAAMDTCRDDGGTVMSTSPVNMTCVPGETTGEPAGGH